MTPIHNYLGGGQFLYGVGEFFSAVVPKFCSRFHNLIFVYYKFHFFSNLF